MKWRCSLLLASRPSIRGTAPWDGSCRGTAPWDGPGPWDGPSIRGTARGPDSGTVSGGAGGVCSTRLNDAELAATGRQVCPSSASWAAAN